MEVPLAETDFVGDFRRKTYHLHFTFYIYNSDKYYVTDSI